CNFSLQYVCIYFFGLLMNAVDELLKALRYDGSAVVLSLLKITHSVSMKFYDEHALGSEQFL
ncbi:hypothetical protein SLEP1_g60545, partial [Rubroshorea leprosula]